MADSIIGLDIGTSGIRAVHLRRRLLGLEWVRGATRTWPKVLGPFQPIDGLRGVSGTQGKEGTPSDDPNRFLKVIQDLWSEIGASRSRVVVSIPAYHCSLRTITMPFTDEKRLTQVIPFEVESQLPFSIEDTVVDHHPLTRDNGHSRLLVAAAPKVVLGGVLALLSKVGIDPAVLDLDALALYTVANYGIKSKEVDPLVVIDVGANKTTLVVMDQGQVRFVRSILQGSQQWTGLLAKAWSVSMEEAEGKKRQDGMEGESDRDIQEALSPWMKEVARTLHVAQVESQKTIRNLVLCGGGSRLKGLDLWMAKAFDLQLQTMNPPILEEKAASWDPSLSLALGLALKGAAVTKASRINFRQGEFTYQKEVEQSRKKTRWVWVGALIFLLMLGLDLGVKYNIRVSNYEKVRGEVRQTFMAMFPQVRNIVDEVYQAETIVGELKKKAALFGRKETTAVGFLGELTIRIPKDVEIKVNELVIDPERIRIDAETESFEAIDRIKAEVLKSDLFGQAEVSNAKMSAKEGWVKFSLTIQLNHGKGGG